VRRTSRSKPLRKRTSRLPARARRNPPAAAGRSDTAARRRESRALRALLPTKLERDTALWPEVIAECVVREAERFLAADLPADYPARLAARAYHLYPRNKHFRKLLNEPGNRGREALYMFMRHWTCGWLKRERSPLHPKLPWEYALGKRLPLKSRQASQP
jgi:hypothetical protein